ncbi:MAG TPA: hypothetical protein VEH27_00745 [Methylomirabilota bacterium]|nr:hypothetical protein [Methylomirabilota bacterium]
MTYTPDMNDGGHVFVFGSNTAGVHGAGAAKEALNHWGARWGVGHGLYGASYAIPTKDAGLMTIPLSVIHRFVNAFIECATDNAHITFLVTRIGCGLAGYKDEDIAPMFKDAPSNCVLPPEWVAILKGTK